MSLRFEISHRSASSKARLGRITTPHGAFDTPAFMPVGTRATVKGVLPDLVAAAGAQIILANTYHLLLRPGPELVARRGGLHRFMNWPGPILTDSGGYQVYSMSDTNRISDDGVEFKSIVDGSTVHLSPERAIQTQHLLGADIIMAFDDCPPSVDPDAGAGRIEGEASVGRARLARTRSGTVSHGDRLDAANERTVRWLERCVREHASSGRADAQSLFGIVQGGADLARREWSASRICAFDLPGFAIGGVAVGEDFAAIYSIVAHTAPLLPEAKPRYLMGVGYERDLAAAVRAGVDMFDCVLPTRNGRNGAAFTPRGQLRLRNAKYAEDDRPIDDSCDCPACGGWTSSPDSGSEPPDMTGVEGSRPFTRAYLRHLFMAGEMLGPILVSLHNLRHFQRLMLDIRGAIRDDDWSAFVRRWPVAGEGVSGPARVT